MSDQLIWLCATCFGSPRSGITKVGALGDVQCAFCSRCASPKEFVYTESARKVFYKKPCKRRVKKVSSNAATEKGLNTSAQSRGVGLKKSAFNHTNNRSVMLRINQLSDKFTRSWQLGLDEL